MEGMSAERNPHLEGETLRTMETASHAENEAAPFSALAVRLRFDRSLLHFLTEAGLASAHDGLYDAFGARSVQDLTVLTRDELHAV